MESSAKRRGPANLNESIASARSPAVKPLWWSYLPATLVAILGVVIADSAYLLSLQREQHQVETAFQEAAQDRVLFVQREIIHAMTIVEDLASFFEASAVVERREFRKFVGPVLKRHAGIRSLQWVSAVSAGDRAAYVARARRSFPPFRITEIDDRGKRIESPDRPMLYPILYVQPYVEHKNALGLDMGADPLISDLLREAELTGEPRVSPVMSFDDPADDSKGFAVAIPVFFDNEEGDDAEGAPAQPTTVIKGFALGVFYVNGIVERALANIRAGGVDIRVFQHGGSGDDPPIYTHGSRLRHEAITGSEELSSDLSFRRDVAVGNQRWELVCTPAPGRFTIETGYSWIILAGGLAFTALLTTYLVTLLGQARRVGDEVEVRTSQLWETVQELNREVAERTSAERELQILNETLEHHIASRTAEAERKAQYLEQFAYVASHDLKAPLRAVSNLAGWIEEDLADKLDDVSREQIALLRDRVQRMHNLIEGLLEYSRVGKTSGPEKLVDTHDLITETIDSLSPPKGFKFKIQRDMPTFYTDRMQLGQVFSNLISNSVKHHRGKRGKVRLAAQDQAKFYEFSVCDDGPGIAPEYHDKIFLMFQTLASGDFENSTGIGLALVKKIVEENGGTIRIESALDKGTCFYFTWPKNRSAG